MTGQTISADSITGPTMSAHVAGSIRYIEANIRTTAAGLPRDGDLTRFERPISGDDIARIRLVLKCGERIPTRRDFGLS